MSGFPNGEKWLGLLLYGIVAILAGATFIMILIYTQRLGGSASFSDTTDIGFLLAGIGVGYVICSITVYGIEKKSQKCAEAKSHCSIGI